MSTPSALRRTAVATVAAAALLVPALPALADSATPTPASSAASAGSRGRTSFVIGMKNEPDSLNPYVGVEAVSYDIYQVLYDYLTDSSADDMSPTPSLAESWETSADGKTWTYHLRHGVKWSDGQDLDADDVVYSFQRAKDGETENGQYGSYVDPIEKITKIDAYTVAMTTAEPSPSMLRLAVPILPEHVWKNVSAKDVGTFANDTNVVSSGPFQLAEVKKGQYYRFTANKNYWNGAPKIDELVYQLFKDDDTMVQALKKGDIDFAEDLTASQFNALKGDPAITLHTAPSTYVFELAFNLGAATTDNKPIGDGNPVLKDINVRKAIDHAIDKKVLVDKVLQGHGSVATGEIPPLYPTLHWDPPADLARGFDPAKANQILDQAGYAKGADGIRVDQKGKKISLRLFGREDNEESKSSVQYIKDWLKDIGIDTKVQIMSTEQLTDVIGKGEYDMFHWDWGIEPDPDFQLSVFTCDQRSTEDKDAISAGWSDSFNCDPAYEALYKKQKTILNLEERAAAVKEAQKWLYDNVVYSTLWNGQTMEAYRNDRFTGFVEQPKAGGSLALQFGTYSYRAIEPFDPAKAAAAAKKKNSKIFIYLAGAGGVVLVLIAIGALVMARRRSTADERE
jgi:peptide/nickel transport system substrate-binding protein